MIKIFIIIVILTIPFSLFYLNLSHLNVEGGLIYAIFVVIAMIERLWETFYTPKDKNVLGFHGDWTLLATIVTYFLVILLMIFSFYSLPTKNNTVVFMGLFIFFTAIALRFSAIKALKNQWAIHVNVINTTESSTLIKSGPYKYIRHPIYLGAILDLIGFAMISNAFIYFFIIFLINTPLYIWRSLYEEKNNIKKFGDEYLKYKKETSFIIPLKWFKFK